MGNWSACNVTCGNGTQFRTQKCVDAAGQAAYGQCHGVLATKERSCREQACRKYAQIQLIKS